MVYVVLLVEIREVEGLGVKSIFHQQLHLVVKKFLFGHFPIGITFGMSISCCLFVSYFLTIGRQCKCGR